MNQFRASRVDSPSGKNKRDRGLNKSPFLIYLRHGPPPPAHLYEKRKQRGPLFIFLAMFSEAPVTRCEPSFTIEYTVLARKAANQTRTHKQKRKWAPRLFERIHLCGLIRASYTCSPCSPFGRRCYLPFAQMNEHTNLGREALEERGMKSRSRSRVSMAACLEEAQVDIDGFLDEVFRGPLPPRNLSSSSTSLEAAATCSMRGSVWEDALPWLLGCTLPLFNASTRFGLVHPLPLRGVITCLIDGFLWRVGC